jgi:hypothetical protein
MVATIELTAKAKGDKNPVVLLKSTNNSTANNENWTIITIQCIEFIKLDLALISLLTVLV